MLRISLLGETTIADGAGTPRPCSPRGAALVAFLALRAGIPQGRQRIAGRFWPESGDAQALTNLRRELHHLRQALADDESLVVSPRDLCWVDRATCRVDLRLFEQARQAALDAAGRGDDDGVRQQAAAAVGHYRGELLPGIDEDWVLEARDGLERQCVELCDLLGAARARAGDLPGALAVARHRVELAPLEEVGYRTLMRRYADLGDRAGAVRTYHQCASVLARDLGVAPDAATDAELGRLLPGGDAPLEREAPGPGPARAAPAAPCAPGGGPPLVGRVREVEALRRAWRSAAGGRPGVVVVRGEPGVGKTRLVAELAGVARAEGALVVASQCFGSSGRLALAPVAEWLRAPAVRAATAGLAPSWRAEVGRLVPGEGAGEDAGESADPGGPPAASPAAGTGVRGGVESWRRHRFFEGLARALTGTGLPTLVVVDNLQWCDAETLDFLAFCLGWAGSAPVLVAATARADSLDRPGELAGWVERLQAAGLLRVLALGPLDARETARLAESVCRRPLGDAERTLLLAATGGFPLHVVEAARAGGDPGSGALPAGDLAAVLGARLDQLTPVVRAVAGLAAAIGRNFPLDLLVESSDLPETDVVGALEELWRRRIVRDLPDGYDFSHDLVRDAAYATLSPPRRWLAHRRVAERLEARHAGDLDTVSAQIAEQYARGGRPDRAVTHYRRAAEVAAGRFAHAEAVRLLRAALDVLTSLPESRDRDLQQLALLERLAAPLNAREGYSSPRLHATLERTVALGERLGQTDSVVTALIGLWTSQFVQGDPAGGHRSVSRALELLPPGSPQLPSAHFAFGGSAVSLGRPAEALEHFQLAAAPAGSAPLLSVGTRRDVHARAWSAHAHWLLGDDAEAERSAAGAVALARSVGDPYSLAVALAYGAITAQLRGDVPTLRLRVRELRALCERYDFAYYREWGLILEGWSRRGASGARLAHQGIRQLRAAGSFARMPYWLSLLADLSECDGSPGAARALLDAALADGEARRDLWWLPEVMRHRARHDRPDRGAARLRAALEMARAHGSAALARRCEHDLAAARPGPKPSGAA